MKGEFWTKGDTAITTREEKVRARAYELYDVRAE